MGRPSPASAKVMGWPDSSLKVRSNEICCPRKLSSIPISGAMPISSARQNEIKTRLIIIKCLNSIFTPGKRILVSTLLTKDDSFCPYPLQAGNGAFLVFVCICCAWEPEETYLYLLAIELPGCAQPFFIITLSVTRFSAGRWGVREVDFLPRLEKKMSKDVRYRDSWS